MRNIIEIKFELSRTGFEFDASAIARRMCGCDLLVSINPWHTASVSELLAALRGAVTVGFFPEFHSRIECDYVGHAIGMAFAVPASMTRGLRLSDFSQPPAIPADAAANAKRFKQQRTDSHPVLFVHADSKPEKTWPRERFERVLDEFLRKFAQFRALIVDRDGKWAGRTRFPDRVVPLSLPLEECFALLRSSDLFLGVDSCHLHAADLFRVPGVGLFGPTTARRWGFCFSPHRHLQAAGSMASIQVADVCHALDELARVALTNRHAVP